MTSLASRIQDLLGAAVPEITGVRIVGPHVDPPPAGRGERFADRVRAVLDADVNPMIAVHGGRVVLVEADQGWVHIRLEGGCQGCSLAEVTIRQGIEPLLRTRVPEMVGLADVADHAAGPRRSSPPRSDDHHGSQSGQASRLDSTDSLAEVTMARVLLLVPASTYRATDFLVAAGRLGLDLVVGSDGALPLSSRLLSRVDPGDLQASVDRLMARSGPVDAWPSERFGRARRRVRGRLEARGGAGGDPLRGQGGVAERQPGRAARRQPGERGSPRPGGSGRF